MRKLLLITAILVIALQGFTQNFPIDTLNSSWIERNEHGEGKNLTIEYFRYFVDGDTIFGDQKFFKIYEEENGSNVKYMGAFREVEGKVYYKGSDYWDFNTDSVVLLYDFTAVIGDTVRTGSWQEFVIQGVDSVMVDGQLRKRLLTDWGHYWIEGIGSMSGFFYPISEIPISYWQVWISCYSINEELVYLNPEFHDCYTLVGTDDTQIGEEITVVPNPVKRGATFRVDNIFNVHSVNLIDIRGVKVSVEYILGHGFIDFNTEQLDKGMYLLEVVLQKRKISKKIIIE